MIDSFSEIGFGVPLTNKIVQFVTTDFSNIFHKSNGKPNLYETNDGKYFLN